MVYVNPSWYFCDESASMWILRVGPFSHDLNLNLFVWLVFRELRLHILINFTLALGLYTHWVSPETIVVLLDHLVESFLSLLVLLLGQI